jgi:hypothetical protein
VLSSTATKLSLVNFLLVWINFNTFSGQQIFHDFARWTASRKTAKAPLNEKIALETLIPPPPASNLGSSSNCSATKP